MKEAMSLGIVVPDKPIPKKTAPPVKKRKQTRRPSPKGGRISATTPGPIFDVQFFIPLTPKTKERPRTSLSKVAVEKAFSQSGGSLVRFKQLLDGIKHKTYTPEDTAVFEKAIATIASAHMRGDRQPYAWPVHVDFVFVMPGEPDHWPTDVTDPDLDNMEKAICDALNKIIWKDDRLMVSKRSTKICGRTTGIKVRVRDITSATGDLLNLDNIRY